MSDFPSHQPPTLRANLTRARRTYEPTAIDRSAPWAIPTTGDPAGTSSQQGGAWTTPPVPHGRPVPPSKVRRLLIRWAGRAVIAGLVVQIVVLLILGSLRVVNPSTTAFMLANTGAPNIQQTVSIDHISRYLLAATVVHEDYTLGTRVGAVEWSAFRDRIRAYLAGEEDPSGSTIPQQLTKNLFLTSSQSAPRKALEFVLANELTLVLSDARILELYLNVAQFGPHLYGVCDATWYYFKVAPYDITAYQAAQLMGILPAPSMARLLPGGGLDTNSVVDDKGNNLINGAANVWLPRELPNSDSWKAVVAGVGITDTARDHAGDRGNLDACSTMPPAVAKLLAGGN